MDTLETLPATLATEAAAPAAPATESALEDTTSPQMTDTTPEVAEQATEETGEEAIAEASEFEVDLMHPNRGAEGAPERFKLSVPDQKTADTLRHNANMAGRVPKLERELETAKESVAILDALERDPVAGMVAIAQTDPKVGAAFVQDWVKANYELAASFLADLGLKVEYGTANKRELDLSAQLARRELDDRVRKSQEQTSQQAHKQRFQQTAERAVRDLTANLTFADPEDEDLFHRAAADKAVKLYQTNPSASMAEVITLLQPLVNKFAGGKPSPIVKAQVRDDKGQFTKAKAVHDKMRKVGSGTGGLSPATPAFTPGMTLEKMFPGS